jgi:hypothetical protein
VNSLLIYRALTAAICVAALTGAVLPTIPLRAQQLTLDEEKGQRRRVPRQTATIHWQGVTLGDAIARLRPVFDDTVFIDRRVDPNRRVSLDIEATSAEQVVSALATEHELGFSRLGKLIYLGLPMAGELRAISATRSREAARLPTALRTTLLGKKPLLWPRLTEPRDLIAKLAAQHGWRLTEAERIPHDLWAAGDLPDLTVVEQLTVLTFGFGLTLELRPTDRTIAIVPLPATIVAHGETPSPNRAGSKPAAPRTTRGTRQVYTLRVQEKPVGAVLRELSQRLHWAIQIDEEAIRAAGKSLDHRVSFSVENADREKLLDALLTPAGLEYHISGEQIRVLPRRYDTK